MNENIKTRVATCSCRKLKVTSKGEPVRISVCHCLECQLRTGAVFSAQARFPRNQVTVEGQYNTHTRVADDGDRLHFHFCPSCGSTVFYNIESVPELIAITVGAFADPQFPSPKFSVYETRKHSWFTLQGEMEHSS